MNNKQIKEIILYLDNDRIGYEWNIDKSYPSKKNKYEMRKTRILKNYYLKISCICDNNWLNN